MLMLKILKVIIKPKDLLLKQGYKYFNILSFWVLYYINIKFIKYTVFRAKSQYDKLNLMIVKYLYNFNNCYFNNSKNYAFLK